MKTGVKCLLVMIGVIVFVGVIVITAHAQPHDEVWVDDDAAPGWYDSDHVRTIQEGIDNASVGGTVYVWDGNYNEDVTVNKTVTIIGNTTVDALNGIYQNKTNLSYDIYGFWVDANYVNISGFSMLCIGGDFSGVHVNESGYCNISGNVIMYDSSDGVSLMDSCNNTIFNNILRYNFYGVAMYGDSINNTVEKNNISYGETRTGRGGETYFIFVKEEGGWTLQKELHFNRRYATQTVELPLPDADGEYKIRISQHGGMAAHIDYVALHDRNEVSPSYAVCLDDGRNVLNKLMYRDNDVADVFERTIEIAWDENVGSSMLILVANEEQPVEMRPLFTPRIMIPELMEHYVIQNDGAVVVDGIPDDLGDADFSSYWMPGSGHPWGTTHLWLRSDGEYLYAIMEVTCDNTYDETGWGSLYVAMEGEIKEFRIDALSHVYGMDGFVYTDKVAWEHIVYEFKIPLEEIGAAIGESIKIGYGCYGTVAMIPNGIYLSGILSPDWNTIKGNIVYDYSPGSGICIEAGHHNVISDNRVFNNGDGIGLYDSHYNTLINNTANDNAEDGWFGDGIYLNESSYNTLINNTANNNYWSGIHLDNSDNNSLLRNTMMDNDWGGIYLYDSHHNTIKDNFASENWYSCPFVYSWDGQEYRFDSQIIPTAARQARESTDYDTLERLMPTDGKYLMKITEELFETSYVDEVKLIVADHPIGTHIISDSEGNIYTLRAPYSPIAGEEEDGTDCLDKVREQDGIYWTSNLDNKDFSEEEDLRDGIILTFEKPEDAQVAKVVVSFQDTKLAEKITYSVTRLPTDFPWQRGLLIKFLRQLHLEVWNGTEWVSERNFIQPGPFIGRDKIKLIDVSGIEGDTITIKLESLTGAVLIDSVRIDYSADETVTTSELCATVAIDTDGIDVALEILSNDNDYLVLEHGDCVYLSFDEIAANQGYERSYIIKARGYYENPLLVVTQGKGQKKLMEEFLANFSYAGKYFLERYASADRHCGIAAEYSSHNTISDNEIVDNYEEGIYLYYSSHNTISGNEIADNDEDGIYLDRSDSNQISHNNIYGNPHGIYLYDSSNNTITWNKIVNNTEIDTGLHIDADSNDNEIHRNCFINNIPQAWDDGQRNSWNYNHWSDYPVREGRYSIQGSANSRDLHTLESCLGPVEQVPALSPIGITLLIGLITMCAVITIKRKQR